MERRTPYKKDAARRVAIGLFILVFLLAGCGGEDSAPRERAVAKMRAVAPAVASALTRPILKGIDPSGSR